MKKYISKHFRDLPTATAIGSSIHSSKDGRNIGQILFRSKTGQYFFFEWCDPGVTYDGKEDPSKIEITHTTEGGAMLWGVQSKLPSDVMDQYFFDKDK